MLARLEPLEKEAELEIDRSGRFVRVRPPSKAGVVKDAIDGRGLTATVLSTADAEKALAANERWFTRKTVREISRAEFHILARDAAIEIKLEAKLTDEQDAKLRTTLASAVDRLVDAIPIERGFPGGEEWQRELLRVVGEVQTESAAFLSAEQQAVLRETLAGFVD